MMFLSHDAFTIAHDRTVNCNNNVHVCVRMCVCALGYFFLLITVCLFFFSLPELWLQ